jgi:hypothetical protein
MDGVREFVRSALIHLRDTIKRPPIHRRDRYLLAVPLINCGYGGGQAMTGEIMKELIGVLMSLVEEVEGCDIVLCLVKEAEFGAAQMMRSQMYAHTHAHANHLPPSLYQEAVRLSSFVKR